MLRLVLLILIVLNIYQISFSENQSSCLWDNKQDIPCIQIKSYISFSRNDFEIGTGSWKNTTILKDEIKIKANIFLFKE